MEEIKDTSLLTLDHLRSQLPIIFVNREKKETRAPRTRVLYPPGLTRVIYF